MLIPFNELFRKHRIKTTGVVHLGANSGQEAQEYQNQGITQVIWVEALPSVFERLKRHIASFPGHRGLMACLSDKDDEQVTFNIANNEEQSSSMLDFETHSKEHPTVKWVGHVAMKTTRFDTLAKRENLTLGEDWFLNVDLQGAELLAMKGMGNLLKHFKYAYIEVNEKYLYKGCPLVGEIDQFLYAHGFVPKDLKMTGCGWGDKFYSRP